MERPRFSVGDRVKFFEPDLMCWLEGEVTEVGRGTVTVLFDKKVTLPDPPMKRPRQLYTVFPEELKKVA